MSEMRSVDAQSETLPVSVPETQSAHDELDAETQSANADVLSETLSDDGPNVRHAGTEPQSADGRRSETQAVDDF